VCSSHGKLLLLVTTYLHTSGHLTIAFLTLTHCRTGASHSTETSQRAVHTLLQGESALGTATVTLRLSASSLDEAKRAQCGDPTAKATLGVTLHNFDCTAKGDFRGPDTADVPTLAVPTSEH
jgi:hypothetical protein